MTVTVWLVAGNTMSSYPASLSLWGWQDLGPWVSVWIPVRLGPALTWEREAQECVHAWPHEWDLSWEGEQEAMAGRGIGLERVTDDNMAWKG